jgi:hypothetical protein
MGVFSLFRFGLLRATLLGAGWRKLPFQLGDAGGGAFSARGAIDGDLGEDVLGEFAAGGGEKAGFFVALGRGGRDEPSVEEEGCDAARGEEGSLVAPLLGMTSSEEASAEFPPSRDESSVEEEGFLVGSLLEMTSSEESPSDSKGGRVAPGSWRMRSMIFSHSLCS